MAPHVEELIIKDAYVITFDRHFDNRGYFNEFFNVNAYPDMIKGSIGGDWKQVAVSMTERVNTIRGLHMSPYNKFCSVLSGGIYDVIVDMREESPTYLMWSAVYITEENKKQVHIPPRCAHGFMTTHPDTRMLYLQGGTFSGGQEQDCNVFDKLLDIHWPLNGAEPIISDKDKNAPFVVHESRRPNLLNRLTMPRALIVGANGQVGGALVRELSAHGYMVYGTHSSHLFPGERTIQFDLEAAAGNASRADALVDTMHPKLIIVCAAFTWVDGAEDAQERARAINVVGPAELAAAAKRNGAKLVLFSTEYVWDGASGPYSEDDPCNPINVYGKTKVEMETKVLATDPTALILRTTVVYGPEKQGKNFVYQLCRNLMQRKRMHVVKDQISTPTYNRDLATMTRLLYEAGAAGVFNACGEEVLGRYDFALLAAEQFGLDTSLIEACTTDSQTQKARRPLNAGMKMDKALAFLGGKFKPRTVKEAIADWRTNPGENNAPVGIVSSSRL